MINDIIREVNLLKHYDWLPMERANRVEIMQEAKERNRQSLLNVSLDDFSSRMYFAGQQGIIEHYLELCEKPIEVKSFC
jgi:hypothetical protein